MIERIPQSVALRVAFKAFLSAAQSTAATGKTIAITISKNGAAFANPSAGATNATEIASGWYYADLSTTDTGTTGPLVIRGTSATIDDVEIVKRVVSAYNAGFTGVADAVAGAASGLAIVGSNMGSAASVTAGVTVSDKTGFSLTSTYDPAKTAAQAGDAMTLTVGERAAIATKIEMQFIDELDGQAVIDAFVAKIAEANPSLDELTLAAIATQVRTELAVELARIDAAISTRLATAGYTAPPDTTAIQIAAAAAIVAYDPPTHAEVTTATGLVPAAVLAAAQAAPIHADTKRINAVTLTGAGTQADPMQPA